MLNSTTKQKINNLRDLLVGKIPNPQGQVQQITLAMIYKFMSDIDDSTNAIFAGKTFFPGEFAQYKWTHLMDSKLSAQERLNLYADGLEKMNHNPNVPQLFRNIFKQAFLPFRDPQTLDRFLRQINELEYEHSEDLGDAYEYLLSSLSAAGDAGQFRTPRHIIDFIVQVVQPSLEDKILDPACGTAGFLISAYKYLTQTYDDIDMSKISDQIMGYDISPEMVQLALVNLYLHHFPDPKIHEYDTLTSEERRAEKFDCILANPPFMTPKGGITPHNKFSVTSNRSEVLFVDYIMEHLRSNGKAGIIVPEGVIFQSANAYKQLRKMLIETGGLWGVVSLPAGVFQPYSGVKTSILLIDKSITTDQIIFAKVTADGYDLGAQRREISKNDLPDLLSDLLALKSNLKNNEAISEITNDLIWSVAKTELSDDYNLSGERYKNSLVTYTGNYERKKISDVAFFQEGPGIRSFEYDYTEDGFPIINVKCVQDGFVDLQDCKKVQADFANNKRNHFKVNAGDILFTTSGTIGRVAIVKQTDLPLLMNTSVVRFRSNIQNLSDKFLYWMLKSDIFINGLKEQATGNTIQNVGPMHIKNMEIPLPPLEVQEEIVKELDGYQAIIDGARQILTNRKPKIEIDPEWEMVKLGEVCEVKSGGTPSKNDITYWTGGSIPWLRSECCKDTIVEEANDYITETGLKNSAAKLLQPGTTLLALVGATIGKTGYLTFESTTNQNIAGLYPKNISELNTIYLWLSVQGLYDEFVSLGDGTFKMANLSFVKDLEIPLPSLEIQQQIVEQIQYEQSLVDSAKELIQLYEQKVKERVERVRNS